MDKTNAFNLMQQIIQGFLIVACEKNPPVNDINPMDHVRKIYSNDVNPNKVRLMFITVGVKLNIPVIGCTLLFSDVYSDHLIKERMIENTVKNMKGHDFDMSLTDQVYLEEVLAAWRGEFKIVGKRNDEKDKEKQGDKTKGDEVGKEKEGTSNENPLDVVEVESSPKVDNIEQEKNSPVKRKLPETSRTV